MLHFWDAERFAGPWFAKTVTGKPGYMWDAYVLYGPNATWDAAPGPLIDFDGTIIDTGPQLREKLGPLIKSS